MSHHISIIGTVGVPANYGGFETLVENLAKFHQSSQAIERLSIYCSSKAYDSHPKRFLECDLRYIPLKANGAHSILYDMLSLLDATLRKSDTILVLGVSGALILPFLRMISRAHIITNIDGIEWRRDKWGWFQRVFLKYCEALAVRYSHEVIADNGAIADYVEQSYGKTCAVIAYGGDHAIQGVAAAVTEIDLPAQYAFNVCRIEPENNVHMILEAFQGNETFPLICVGNWDFSAYGIALKEKYKEDSGVHILDPIYDIGKLKTLRMGASAYIHGHSAGGTNPSLVEMMHFGVPIFAYDCTFNRYTTADKAIFFSNAEDLRRKIIETEEKTCARVGAHMRDVAEDLYTWNAVGDAYFSLLRSDAGGAKPDVKV